MNDIYYCEICGYALDENMKCYNDTWHTFNYYTRKLFDQICYALKIDKLLDWLLKLHS